MSHDSTSLGTSVAAEATLDAADGHFIAIKIGTPSFELNIAVPIGEIPLLARVRGRRWSDGALRIGRSAGAAAWWSVDDEHGVPYLSILVGHDDQTWDIAAQLPIHTIEDVVREVEASAKEAGWAPAEQPQGKQGA